MLFCQFFRKRADIGNGEEHRVLFIIIQFKLRKVRHSPAAQLINTTIARHLEQPVLERFVRANRRKGEIELKQYLLVDITGLVIITKKVIDKVKERRAIAIGQRFKSLLISYKCLLNQVTVRNHFVLSGSVLSYLHERHLAFYEQVHPSIKLFLWNSFDFLHISKHVIHTWKVSSFEGFKVGGAKRKRCFLRRVYSQATYGHRAEQ